MNTWVLIIMMYGSVDSGAAIHNVNFYGEQPCREAAKAVADATKDWSGPYGKRPVVSAVCVRQT